MPVYILNGQFPYAFLGDEDLVLVDGDPHSKQGPIALGHNPMHPN